MLCFKQKVFLVCPLDAKDQSRQYDEEYCPAGALIL